MQELIHHCVLEVIAESAGTPGEGVYLIAVLVKGKGSSRKIEILADADTGIRISQCAWLSRRIREKLEAAEDILELIGENFDLMVSSPGLGEPLIVPRQYIRHIGKPFRVRYTDSHGEQAEIAGYLKEVSLADEGAQWISLIPEKVEKQKPRSREDSVTIYLSQVTCAVPEAVL